MYYQGGWRGGRVGALVSPSRPTDRPTHIRNMFLRGSMKFTKEAQIGW